MSSPKRKTVYAVIVATKMAVKIRPGIDVTVLLPAMFHSNCVPNMSNDFTLSVVFLHLNFFPYFI